MDVHEGFGREGPGMMREEESLMGEGRRRVIVGSR